MTIAIGPKPCAVKTPVCEIAPPVMAMPLLPVVVIALPIVVVPEHACWVNEAAEMAG